VPGELRQDSVVVTDPAEASALHNRGWFGTALPGGGLALTLLEAVYLAEVDRLVITRRERPVPMRELYRAASATVDQFEIRYIVFRDLRQRGYVVEERPGPPDFQVFPRGGAPKRTPSKYWVQALSERAVFDLDSLWTWMHAASAVRKSLLLAVVDEESDLTYYAVREAQPRGHGRPPSTETPTVVHFLGDRAMVVDEAQARAVHASGFFGKIVGRRLQLSLLETAYLLKAGRVQVRNADSDRPIGLPRLLKEARAAQPDFDLRLRVYEDLASRGITAKTGFKYGSHFRAYEGDPEAHHSKYLVHALPKGYRGMWPEVSRGVRLAHGVRKALLLGEVGEEVRYARLERVRP